VTVLRLSESATFWTLHRLICIKYIILLKVVLLPSTGRSIESILSLDGTNPYHGP
jgi:hypothetical protein